MKLDQELQRLVFSSKKTLQAYNKRQGAWLMVFLHVFKPKFSADFDLNLSIIAQMS